MSEKLYRIPPLVWHESDSGEDKLRAAAEAPGLEQSYFLWGRELWFGLFKEKISDDANRLAAQRDYEQRLISAGVVEPVEEGK